MIGDGLERTSPRPSGIRCAGGSTRRRGWRAAIPALAALSALVAPAGCISLHLPCDVECVVRDVETGEPVPGATVSVRYSYFLVLNAPRPSSAVTDGAGRATVAASTFRNQEWIVSCDGFSEFLEAGHEGVSLPRQRSFLGTRGEAPRLEIVVPDAFEGWVLIERTLGMTAPERPIGTRRLRYEAADNGYVAVPATPLERLAFGAVRVDFRRASGASIAPGPYRVTGDIDRTAGPQAHLIDIDFRRSALLFAIGDAALADRLREELLLRDPKDPSYRSVSVEARVERIESMRRGAGLPPR